MNANWRQQESLTKKEDIEWSVRRQCRRALPVASSILSYTFIFYSQVAQRIVSTAAQSAVHC